MNKFRDFIYDKSDIIVALVIISIAGLIVFSRIDAILSYPETFAANAPAASEPAITGEDVHTTTAAVGTDDVEMLAIYINYGESLQSIADKFVTVNLYATADEFLSAIDEANVATEIKTGNFIIPANATSDEILAIITKPGL